MQTSLKENPAAGAAGNRTESSEKQPSKLIVYESDLQSKRGEVLAGVYRLILANGGSHERITL
jgi:hypothetical protein